MFPDNFMDVDAYFVMSRRIDKLRDVSRGNRVSSRSLLRINILMRRQLG